MAVLHKEHTRTANSAEKIDNAHDILLQSTKCVLDTMKEKHARLEQYIEECKDLFDKVVQLEEEMRIRKIIHQED
jgi:uncharacterized protein YoxC